jgi:hypothetical protein
MRDNIEYKLVEVPYAFGTDEKSYKEIYFYNYLKDAQKDAQEISNDTGVKHIAIEFTTILDPEKVENIVGSLIFSEDLQYKYDVLGEFDYIEDEINTLEYWIKSLGCLKSYRESLKNE